MSRSLLTWSRLAAIGAAALVPVLAPTAASASGTATYSGGVMTVTSGTGDADWTSIGFGTAIAGVQQVSAINHNPRSGVDIAVTPGTGCTTYGTLFAQCPQPPITSIVVNSGDQNDRLYSNQDSTTFNAGTGDDWFAGNPNNPYHPTFNGGSGFDTVNYNFGSVALNASIDGVRNDGYLSTDNIGTDVERIIGGYGNDTLTGASGSRSTLMGQAGNDTLNAGAFGADLWGGPGNDTMNGGVGNDTFTDYTGTDTMIGGAGDDTFHADDGDNADSISCGAGYDVAFVDSVSEIADWGTDGSTTSCEQVIYE